jgi:hypothetical protein
MLAPDGNDLLDPLFLTEVLEPADKLDLEPCLLSKPLGMVADLVVFCARNFGQELRLMRRPFESVFYDIQLAS